GGMFVILKPFDERKGNADLTAKAVAAKLVKAYKEKILSAQVAVFGAPPIDGLGSTGGFKLFVQDRTSLGPRFLEGGVTTLTRAAAQQPGLAGLFTSFSANQPQFKLDVGKDQAATRGVALSDLYDTLGVYFGSAYVNDFTYNGRNWQVIVQADPSFRRQVRNVAS